MVRSMTGFGRVVGELDGEMITLEVSSVNHRFLEPTFRLPSIWSGLEGVLREILKKQVSRGKVTVAIRRERGITGRVRIQYNREAAQRYIEASRDLASMMDTGEALTLNTLARLEGVFHEEEEEQDLDKVAAMLTETMSAALAQFNTARETEGNALADDIAERVAQMRDALDTIEARLPELNTEYETRLRTRVAELGADVSISEDRIALELALLADKGDVNEEVVRLKSHFAQVTAMLQSSDPIGRELNFLSQEIQREINTLGSKLRDIGVTREAMRMKCELEKLREQAQNVE
jgi:uncharacterized protein (TIGR00255 family)